MILPAMKMMMKIINQSTKMSSDPLECDPPKQLVTNLLVNLAALETTPLPLKIFLKMIRKIKHADLKGFTPTNSMEIAPKPQDFWPLLIDSCL